MGQHQLESPDTFLPVTETETIKPPKCKSGEAPPPADDDRLVETHDTSEEQAHHRVFDMGCSNFKPQEFPGMEIDAVTHVVAPASDDSECDLKELKRALTRDAKDELSKANRDILSVVRALGGDHNRYKRERRAVKAIVSEVYSPRRVTAATKLLSELRLIPGFALDVITADVDGTHWDFDSKEMRGRAHMCTAFSTWQRINNTIRYPVTVAAEKRRAVQHLEFWVELYREQMRHGRYFVHERPAYASSWQEAMI